MGYFNIASNVKGLNYDSLYNVYIAHKGVPFEYHLQIIYSNCISTVITIKLFNVLYAQLTYKLDLRT
jgi:hypothetical protein